jgi:hypothetical protein
MHQRVCREANVMARSSAFGASFCSRSIISILVQQKPGDGIVRKRLEMPLMRLKQCHERRKLLVESANLNSRIDHIGICRFDLCDISSSFLRLQ